MKTNKNLQIVSFLAFFCFLSECLSAQQISDTSAMQKNTPLDIKAVLVAGKDYEKYKSTNVYDKWDKKNMGFKYSIFTFDYHSLAMHVDQYDWENKQDNTKNKVADDNSTESSPHGVFPIYEYLEYEERPMYFDYEGYVYTKGKGKKGRWVKTPLTTLYKFMSVPFAFPEIFPELKIPETNYTYYGIDVSPGRYPILEWAFRYKMLDFEASDNFMHEFVEYSGEWGNSKYTLQTGKDKGSFVIFDGLGRLREINSIHSGMIQYTYGNYTVKLPDSNKTDYFADQLQLMDMIKKQ